jgi:hypothetical protein
MRDPFAEPWEPGRPAIYDFLRRHIVPGVKGLPDEARTLPDDEIFNSGARMRWVPGGLDGVSAHHGGRRESAVADTVFAAFQAAAQGSDAEALSSLYRLLLADNVMDYINDLVPRLVKDLQAPLSRAVAIARLFAIRAPDRGPVKVGWPCSGFPTGTSILTCS